MTSWRDSIDIAVIGLGPGGEYLAGRLAKAGLSVLAVEKHLVGGECPYYGCVPSKMLIRAGNVLAEARRVPQLAGSVQVAPDFTVAAQRIADEATDNWNDTVAAERLARTGAHLVRGVGRLAGPGRVRVDDDEFAVRRGIVLNTGTAPAVPPIPGLADTPLWTNRDALRATAAPESLLVLGGGAIGVELAQAFARFGSEVTVIEAGDRLLSLDEPESSALLAQAFAAEGIDVRRGARAVQVSYADDRFTVILETGEQLTGAQLLVAVGRKPGLAGLGLETFNMDPDVRSLTVDDRMRVAPGLWAIGDITGKGAFTHVSMYQAEVAARDILNEPGEPADYVALPHVTFTDPEIGGVGMTEAQAQAAGITVRVGHTALPSSTRGWIHKAGNDGFIKLVADADRGVLVGATSAGPVGGEVLSLLALAVHAAVPISQLRTMIYAYPTFHRAIQDALGNLDVP